MFLTWIGITQSTPFFAGHRDQKSGVSGVIASSSAPSTRST